MKKLLFSFVFSTVLLMTGCQENSIIDPNPEESLIKSSLPPGTVQGTIPLEGLLEVPGSQNTFYEISGEIDYTHEMVLEDSIPPAPQYYIELNLNTNATLNNPDAPNEINLTISNESTDIFYVSEEGIYMLEKTFPVQGSSNGLMFVCRFLVTTDGNGLNSMWLTIDND